MQNTSLSDLLAPLLREKDPPRGRWSWLAKRCRISRASVAGWLDCNRVPALKVDAVCDLLGASPELRAELRRRAGFAVIVDAGPVEGSAAGEAA